MRPHPPSHLLGPYEEWLEARWHSGCQIGQQLWQELKELGYKGSRNTVAPLAAKRRARHNPSAPDRQRVRAVWNAPSRRRCAWYLSQAPDQIDTEIAQFLGHLYAQAQAPELCKAAEPAVQFVKLFYGKDVTQLDKWLDQAAVRELGSFAVGIARNINAVKGAISTRWTTSSVEGQVSRVKAIKRQMYGRANYQLLRQRVSLAA